MLRIVHSMAGAAILIASTLLATPTATYAQTGSVQIDIRRVGFIVGVGGGSGTLTYKGRRYPLSIGGVSIGTIGVSRADLVGYARNLRRASDIAGTYTAVSTGLAIAGGGLGCEIRTV